MLWTFHRGTKRFDVEIRRVARGSELVIRHPDGHQTIEVFPDDAELNQRVEALQRSLLESGWFVSRDPRR